MYRILVLSGLTLAVLLCLPKFSAGSTLTPSLPQQSFQQGQRDRWKTALPPDAVLVVEILGQSNSWGTKSFLEDVPPGSLENVGQSFIWDKIGSLSAHDHVEDGAWAPLGVGFGRSGPRSFGPEMVLSQLVQRHLDRPLYIIKCSRGQTILAERAAVIDWSPDSVGEMFDLWRDYCHRPAMQALAAMHGPENIYYLGINWFQGAADAKDWYNLPTSSTNRTCAT